MKCTTCKLKLPRDAFAHHQQTSSTRRCMRCVRIEHPAAHTDKTHKYIPRQVESLQTLAALAFFQLKGHCYGCLDCMALPNRIRGILKGASSIGAVWRERTRAECDAQQAIAAENKKKAAAAAAAAAGVGVAVGATVVVGVVVGAAAVGAAVGTIHASQEGAVAAGPVSESSVVEAGIAAVSIGVVV
jgi:hypothetical protein